MAAGNLQGGLHCGPSTGPIHVGPVFKKIPPKVWIIGASQVRRAEPVAQQTYGDHFGLRGRVHWFGKGGMGWSGIMPRFYDELAELEVPPEVLVLHAGGNDLGLVDPNELVSRMETDLRKLKKEFPKMKIVFSLLHERQRWRYGPAPKIEQIRKLVNSKLRRLLRNLQCEVVEHQNIRFFHKGVFVPDGVHFTQHGNKIFLDNIHKVVKKTLENCGPQLEQGHSNQPQAPSKHRRSRRVQDRNYC